MKTVFSRSCDDFAARNNVFTKFLDFWIVKGIFISVSNLLLLSWILSPSYKFYFRNLLLRSWLLRRIISIIQISCAQCRNLLAHSSILDSCLNDRWMNHFKILQFLWKFNISNVDFNVFLWAINVIACWLFLKYMSYLFLSLSWIFLKRLNSSRFDLIIIISQN